MNRYAQIAARVEVKERIVYLLRVNVLRSLMGDILRERVRGTSVVEAKYVAIAGVIEKAVKDPTDENLNAALVSALSYSKSEYERSRDGEWRQAISTVEKMLRELKGRTAGMSDPVYTILGLLDEMEVESRRVEYGNDHADFRWRLSLFSSKRWSYNFKKGTVFCWSKFTSEEKDVIREHMKERYGIFVSRFNDSGAAYSVERNTFNTERSMSGSASHPPVYELLDNLTADRMR